MGRGKTIPNNPLSTITIQIRAPFSIPRRNPPASSTPHFSLSSRCPLCLPPAARQHIINGFHGRPPPPPLRSLLAVPRVTARPARIPTRRRPPELGRGKRSLLSELPSPTSGGQARLDPGRSATEIPLAAGRCSRGTPRAVDPLAARERADLRRPLPLPAARFSGFGQ